jgi:beta-phosphoglucomutase-like phosphatase (HAD superfamily)
VYSPLRQQLNNALSNVDAHIIVNASAGQNPEIAPALKPQPQAYLRNVEAVGLHPSGAMMVAAQNGNPIAAASCGLKTIFVPRPNAYSLEQTSDRQSEHDFELVSSNFIDLGRLPGD